MSMTPEARRALSDTVRHLRASLVEHLHGAIESRWRPSLAAEELDAADRRARERFEEAIAERTRGTKRSAAEVRADLERLAAATWLNRLVFLRIFEALAPAHRKSARVVTGYKSSPAYTEFVRDYAGPLGQDDTFGYAVLLRVLFDELALDLPGLYGKGLADLLPFPPAALNELVEKLNAPALDSCWTDDTTPGWVYQYWNDPDREALDKKLADGGKVAPHEIASKTQMFTERYMVEWLLHNSLGPAWLAICRRNQWTAEVDRDGVLVELDRRRAEWRGRRERGEVALDALMPLESDVERRWAYFVPHERTESTEGVPDSVRGLRILDPACGSGHFLVIAFDLLVALYEEEARHRGSSWTRREIAAWILEDNLHGVDLDPRAVQIAAAALWSKARQVAPDAHPKRMNLVAADLGLSRLGADDPARRRLVAEIGADTGLKAEVVEAIWTALAEVDTLGTLLQVDRSVLDVIRDATDLSRPVGQGRLFAAPGELPFAQVRMTQDEALTRVLGRVEQFLGRHTGADDLGLRLSGEQLAAGVRFLGLVREGHYHLVVGNPPYQGTGKMVDAKYVAKHYPRGKADLYAAFIERALQLCVPSGTSALLTMRNWMFIAQYQDLREWLLTQNDVRRLGDVAVGAFDDVPNDVLSVVGSVIRKAAPSDAVSIGMQPSRPDVPEYDRERTKRKRAAVLAQVGRFEFRTSAFEVIPGRPLVYWWRGEDLQAFVAYPLLGTVAAIRQGMATSDNPRFVRQLHEVDARRVLVSRSPLGPVVQTTWAPYIKGGQAQAWFGPLEDIVQWARNGLEVKTYNEIVGGGSHSRNVKNEDRYFTLGVAFSPIGSRFSARRHRFASIIGHMGSSAFTHDLATTTALLNSSFAARILQGLNPGIHFEVGDVNRLPMFPIQSADDIVATLDAAFTAHEAHREPSVEFRHPGPSPWEHAQAWAQQAVDRPAGAPLPPYTEVLVPEPPTDHVSYALGVALGRFHADGSGIVDPATADLSHALPAGLLFLDGAAEVDDLDMAPAQALRDAWKAHGPAIDGTADTRGLRTWLRSSFFAVHKKMYDNRPIHWPLSSANRTFVAWVNIHRMGPHTLTAVLARAEQAFLRLKGRATDLRQTRDSADAQASKAAEKLVATVQKQLAEAETFVATIRTLANKGPEGRAVDAPYAPDLDDGVMINSAALWPLLDPQWKDPKKWWGELSKPSGRKDYDWSHLAARYWPERVDAKCKEDPSLGVAHGCFWRYHPARAYAWELRLQDEIGPDFRIDEPDADVHRAAFLRDQPMEAEAIRAKEEKRREKKKAKAQDDLFDAGDQGDVGEEAEA
jgi:hypothetical protein